MRISSPIASALTALVPLVLAGASTSACSLLEAEDPPSGVTFQYEAPTCSLYACTPTNREVLTGSTVTVLASSEEAHHEARLVSDVFATIVAQSETCSCATSDGKSNTRLQDPGAECPAKHRKSCSLSVELATKQPGDAVLEILQGGAPLAETTVKVRTARRIEAVVGYGFSVVAPAGGTYEVKVGVPIQVSPRLFGEELAMLATKDGVTFSYDAARLSPTELSLTTSSVILQVVPLAAGASRVSIKAGEAESTLELRVVP